MHTTGPAQDGGMRLVNDGLSGAGGRAPAPRLRGPPEAIAAILAGGQGTRLREIVPDKPKVLAPVAGRPFLTYLLAQLEKQGFCQAVICTGHMGERVREVIGPQFGNLRVAYSHETSPLGTGGALRLALRLLDSPLVLVMNGDSFCGADLGALLAFHAQAGHPPAATLAVVQVPDARRFGRVRFGQDGRITEFQEKDRSAGPGWINAGVYAVERDAVADIPPGTPISLEKDLFPRWLARGLFAWPARGAPFIDIGCPEAYREAQAFFGPGGPGADL